MSNVTVQFIGRATSDAAIQKNSNGDEYIKMRMAVNGWNNGQAETIWFEVFVPMSKWSSKMSQYWKKGSLLQVVGSEKISLFTTTNGETRINRTVNAYNVDLVTLNTNKANSEETTQQKEEEGIKPSLTMSKIMAMSSASKEDDLPF